MRKEFDNVYQFKITLKGINPPIWRRIQVPETYNINNARDVLEVSTVRRVSMRLLRRFAPRNDRREELVEL